MLLEKWQRFRSKFLFVQYQIATGCSPINAHACVYLSGTILWYWESHCCCSEPPFRSHLTRNLQWRDKQDIFEPGFLCFFYKNVYTYL